MKTVVIQGFTCNAETGKPMGRPPKDPHKRKLWESLRASAADAQTKKHSPPIDLYDHAPTPEMTDDEIVEEVAKSFKVMQTVVESACEGGNRSVVISGAGGVGKSYTVEEITNRYVEEEGIKAELVSGVVTPIHLYITLYQNREENNVVILDDADGIFFNEQSIALLKAAMDSKATRRITWKAESNVLTAYDAPKSFIYEGMLIFLTNIDFQRIIDTGGSKLTEHLDALMNRAVYLDLMLHDNRTIYLWIDHLVREKDILVEQCGMTEAQQDKILKWMGQHRDGFRNLSIRTAQKIAQHMKKRPKEWEDIARKTELRNAGKK
jgi:hypothetical protein